MNEVYAIRSDYGNEYIIQFSTECSGLIAEELLDQIKNEGIEIVEIDLGHTKGTAPVSPRILAQIEQIIADMFLSHPNVIICFFCDFIHAIPAMNKRKEGMTVQQYRSQLFSRMFERFTNLHHIDNVYNRVVVIQGVAEPYFFHIISRKEHLKYADAIADAHHKDFDK